MTFSVNRNVADATARAPLGPILGHAVSAGASAAAIDLSAYAGSFVKIQVDPETADYALFGMRSATGGTLPVTAGTSPTDQEGVAKLGAGGELEFAIDSENPFLTYQRANSTNVTFFYWIS